MKSIKNLAISASAILILTFSMVNCTKDQLDIPEQNSTNDLNLKSGTLVTPVNGTIQFSGYTWNVRSGVSSAPGPNNWSPDNVWVDGSGKLHLRITWNATAAKWECAEVSSSEFLGFGTYEWTVEGKLDQLHPDVVFGMFNYLSASRGGTKKAGEIDIEFSKWGIPTLSKPGSFTVWPPDNMKIKNLSTSFAITSAQTTTFTKHSFTWNSKSVSFLSTDGLGSPIASATFAPSKFNTTIPQKPAPAIMNLWVFRGISNTLPTDHPVEIVISSFVFKPL
jgi:hypothetical protein